MTPGFPQPSSEVPSRPKRSGPSVFSTPTQAARGHFGVIIPSNKSSQSGSRRGAAVTSKGPRSTGHFAGRAWLPVSLPAASRRSGSGLIRGWQEGLPGEAWKVRRGPPEGCPVSLCQCKNIEWVLVWMMWCAQSSLTLCDPVDCSPPGSSLSTGFPRQEYWSGLSFPPPPGHLPEPRIEPASPALAGGFFATEPPGKQWCGKEAHKEEIALWEF